MAPASSNRRPLSAPSGGRTSNHCLIRSGGLQIGRGRGITAGLSTAAKAAMTMFVEAEATEVAELQQRLGNWQACLAPKDRGTNAVGSSTRPSSQMLSCGHGVEMEAQAFNPSEVGFRLVSKDEVVAKSPQRTLAQRTPGDTVGIESKPISQSSHVPKDSGEQGVPIRPARAESWQRHPRNRKGCSPEVKARERRRLEKAVRSCGLLLDPDPSAPSGERLRAAPVEKVRRSRKEQHRATQQLLAGMSVDSRRKHGGSETSTAHLLLQVEQRRLSGLPCHPSSSSTPSLWSQTNVEACQRDHALSAASGQLGQNLAGDDRARHGRSQGDQPHMMPSKQSVAILCAAHEGKVPVHLTCHNSALIREDYGPPSKSLQEAILAAALSGAIPVRSITAATTKHEGAGTCKVAFLSTSVGPSEISSADSGSARSIDDDLETLGRHHFHLGGIASEPSSEGEDESDTDQERRLLVPAFLHRAREVHEHACT